MPDTTSFDLLNQVRAGDQRAWSELSGRYLPMVYHWALCSKLRSEDAADIAQEVFLKVARGIHTLERTGDSGSFRGWLRVITRNAIIDWLRKHGAEARGAGGTTAQQLMLNVKSADTWTELTATQLQWMEKVDDVRNEFETHTWQAFWLLTVEGMTGAEVAKQLSMNRGAVYQAKSRVLMRLRQVGGLTD